MRTLRTVHGLRVASIVGVLLGSIFFPTAVRAQSSIDAKYQCVRLEVGKQTGECQSPPLILSQDGSYQIWGEHGTYEVVQDRWLVLSHSKRRGLGHFVGSDEIVFEYKIDGKVWRVTFRQIYEPPPGVDLG